MDNIQHGNIQRTFAFIRPDFVEYQAEILSMIAAKGLIIKKVKLRKASLGEMRVLYIEHKGQPWYCTLTTKMSNKKGALMIVEGIDAVKELRKLVGATDPLEALPGTIRNIFGQKDGTESERREANVMHSSASVEDANREMQIFFDGIEINQVAKTKTDHRCVNGHDINIPIGGNNTCPFCGGQLIVEEEEIVYICIPCQRLSTITVRKGLHIDDPDCKCSRKMDRLDSLPTFH